MLADKSGLRRKETIPSDPSKKVERLKDNELKDILSSFGFGTATQTETSEEKANRIRKEINNG